MPEGLPFRQTSLHGTNTSHTLIRPSVLAVTSEGKQSGEGYLPLAKLESPLCSPRLARRRRVGPRTKAGIRGVDVVTDLH